MSANIFISFASQDLKIASTICSAIEGRGFKCWISSRDILPGENFQSAIVRAIRGARIMLLVFTANSNRSEEMTKELALASQQKLMVVPLRVEDVTPSDAFAYEFATRQWIDLFADWELAMNQLCTRIAAALANEPHSTEPIVLGKPVGDATAATAAASAVPASATPASVPASVKTPAPKPPLPFAATAKPAGKTTAKPATAAAAAPKRVAGLAIAGVAVLAGAGIAIGALSGKGGAGPAPAAAAPVAPSAATAAGTAESSQSASSLVLAAADAPVATVSPAVPAATAAPAASGSGTVAPAADEAAKAAALRKKRQASQTNKRASSNVPY